MNAMHEELTLSMVVKKMETCTFKLNIRENRILQITGGGATCRHYAYFIHVLLFFIKKFLCDVTDGYA